MLPTVISVARWQFRQLRCTERQEDLIQEVVSLAWKWHRRLVERGRSAQDFIVAFAKLAARAVQGGRRVCGQEPVRDVMSRSCQRKHCFIVAATVDSQGEFGRTIDDALSENTQSPVPDQVQFRGDFPAWAKQLSPGKREVMEHLALGHQTQLVAKTFGVSSARISQMRRELRQDYLHFLQDSVSE